MSDQFEDINVYGDYRGAATNRSELSIEDQREKGFTITVEDGDAGGRGAERKWASHTMERETAFELHAWLSKVLFS